MNRILSLLLVAAPFLLAHPIQHSQIQWIECNSTIPFTLDTTDVDLSQLPSTLHCGQIVVPMDYAKPLSPSNNITLGLAMYRPEIPKGVVFFNAGGTDENTIFAWQAALNQTQMFSGLEDFDLMMMDTRGTYHSNPLNVSLDTFQPLIGAYPTTEAQFMDFQNWSKIMFESWNQLSSPPGIIGYVSTKELVQDLDWIRRALGYDVIHFIGDSYGSYRAAQYAVTFPRHVGRFVLDAVAAHGRSIFDQAQDGIAAANRALQRADAYCQNNASCPFNSEGRGSVPKAYQQILAAAEVAPIPASLCNGTECVSPVEAYSIQQGMYDLLQGADDLTDFPLIFEILAAALQGDASGFAEAAGDPVTDISSVWGVPLECGDYGLQNLTFSDFEQSYSAAMKIDTYGIGRNTAWQLQLACSGWPYPTSPSGPYQLRQQMLMVTADFDPSAPTEWTRVVWQESCNSSLVIRHGDDHVSFQLPDQPSTLMEKQFITTGILPDATNQTLVTVYPPGAQLAPIANPYDVPTGAIAGGTDSGP